MNNIPMDQSVRDSIISTNYSHYLITASAGSGKTTILVDKSFSLINRGQIKPYQQIAFITFTRLATRQIRDKIRQKLMNEIVENKDVYLNRLKVSTTESFAVIEVIKPFLRDAYDLSYPKKDDIVQDYNVKFENFEEGLQVLKEQKVLGSYFSSQNNFIYELASKVLFYSNNACLYLKAKYPIVMIDEYQDVDFDMHNFYIYLKDNLYINLFVVGDIKQLLYSFRGANESIIKSLANDGDFSKYSLFHNFRSEMSIIKFSYHFTNEQFPKGYQFEDKVYFYKNDDFERLIQDISINNDENERYAYIYARFNIWNRDRRALEENEFVQVKNPPINSGYPNYGLLEPLLKWYFNQTGYNTFNVLDDIYADVSQKNINLMDLITDNIYSNPKKSLKLYEKVLGTTLSETEKNKFIETLEEEYRVNFSLEELNKIALTIHAAKGLEYDHVVIDADSFFFNGEFQKQNHYVAITRPKKSLRIIMNDEYEAILNNKDINYKLETL